MGSAKAALKIAIDGPAASGKNAVGLLLARHLGYTFIDTGAMYRALAYLALREGVALEDEKALEALAFGLKLEFAPSPESQTPHKVLVNREDVTEKLHWVEIDQGASTLSQWPLVRRALVAHQREVAAAKGNVVMVGRDIGTVVLPDAQAKFYLEASSQARARRRYLERQTRGEDVSHQEVLEDLLRRDQRDQSREASPLRPASDARIINTEGKTPEAIVEELLALLGREPN